MESKPDLDIRSEIQKERIRMVSIVHEAIIAYSLIELESLLIFIVNNNENRFEFVSTNVPKLLGWSYTELTTGEFYRFVSDEDKGDTINAHKERKNAQTHREEFFINTYKTKDGGTKKLCWLTPTHPAKTGKQDKMVAIAIPLDFIEEVFKRSLKGKNN